MENGMTQFQLDTILKIIELGAPVMYHDLANALGSLIEENHNLRNQVEYLKSQLDDAKGSDKPEFVGGTGTVFENADSPIVKEDK